MLVEWLNLATNIKLTNPWKLSLTFWNNCVGETNVVHEWYKFNTRTQVPGDTFDAFYSELCTLADKCAFDYLPSGQNRPLPLDEMLKDRIFLGMRDDDVKKKFISQGNNLTLDQAVCICRSNEVTSTVMLSVTKGAGSESVDAVHNAQSRRLKQKPNK